MDILVESTKHFEGDLANLEAVDRASTIQKINDCASLFSTHKADVYRKLRRLRIPPNLNGYESSLYTLRISQKLRVILTVDEDPIFGQVIFTLFRAVDPDQVEAAYQGVSESLYQELRHNNQAIAQIS
jgi:hypothetical protein